MIYIAADHRGVGLKGKIEEWLKGRDYEFEDLGAYEYSDLAPPTSLRIEN